MANFLDIRIIPVAMAPTGKAFMSKLLESFVLMKEDYFRGIARVLIKIDVINS